MADLHLHLADGSELVLPASLDSMTTYVLIEQEAWFEKEPEFVLRWLEPGMTVVDVGANVGIYAVPMARRVGTAGHVYAYEPASEPRSYLEKSVAANGLANVTAIAAALSDAPREGRLSRSSTSELHSLGGEGEAVAVTTLDAEAASRNWPSPDFVKIDAEGEELKIAEGGRDFFTRNAPLVMFEIKDGGEQAMRVRAAFLAMGYRIFRQLYGAPLLVPVAAGEEVDPYEFNLFAAKPERAAALARAGYLVEGLSAWTPDEAARAHALDFLMMQRFAPVLAQFLAAPLDPDYRDALAAYAASRDAQAAPATRYAALLFAFRTLEALAARAPAPGRLSTLARVAWEAGARRRCTAALNALNDCVRANQPLHEPFWPAMARYDAIAPGHELGHWFIDAVMEQWERASNHSSRFAEKGIDLEWLAAEPFVSAEMERRRVLKRLYRGEHVRVPERLTRVAPDHINAELWRSGAIPNTIPAA